MRHPLENLVIAALAEDNGQEDVTTLATVAPDARCQAHLLAKADGVLSGIKPFRLAFALMEAEIEDWKALSDGAAFQKGDEIARFRGNTQSVLTAERTAMNFIQHLSGVATYTAEFVKAIDGFNCRVCDTRKTTPMLRALEKAAVVHGGGANHRHTLLDAILIKENHITAAGGITNAFNKARRRGHHLLRVEVEVRNLDEFDEAVAAGADVIMLDNMDLDSMREAVRRVKGKKVILEASGNVNLQRVRDIAETGVDVISVGALTHSSRAVDMTLLIDNT